MVKIDDTEDCLVMTRNGESDMENGSALYYDEMKEMHWGYSSGGVAHIHHNTWVVTRAQARTNLKKLKNILESEKSLEGIKDADLEALAIGVDRLGEQASGEPPYVSVNATADSVSLQNIWHDAQELYKLIVCRKICDYKVFEQLGTGLVVDESAEILPAIDDFVNTQ